jgi:cyclophilin family peptidyl-prolyl cis-trans isomerase/HEAT repeat protein
MAIPATRRRKSLKLRGFVLVMRLHAALAALALAAIPGLVSAKAKTAGEQPPRRPSALAAAGDTQLILRIRAGLIRAEDERDATDPAIAAALSHPLASVRARAVRALGRIGDPGSVPAVSRMLVDRDREVQREAIFALGEIESPSALTPLMGALSSDDREQRALAAEALAKIKWGGAADKARAGGLVVTRILQPGAERDPEVVARALRASWRFGADAPGLVKAIGDSYLRPESAVSEAAAFAAARLGDPRLGSMLELAAARDDRATVRASGARGLGRLARGTGNDRNPERERALDRRAILIRRAFDVDPAVRVAALDALAPFPPAEPVITQEFMDYSLRSDDSGLQRAALTLVGEWKVAGELPTVLRVVQQGPRDLFAEAAAALVKLQGRDAIPALAKAAASSDWAQRAAVADALGAESLGADKDAMALQDRLLADADPRVVASALDAAIGSGRVDAPTIALAHLGAKDVVVRAVAASALPKLVSAQLSKDEAASALRRAWKESAADASKDARISSLEALSDLLGAGANADLVAAAGDPDWTVRMKAHELLGAGAPPLGTASLGRPLAFYVERAQDEMSGEPRILRLDTDRGPIDVVLATSEAPLATFQMSELARRGYFDGLTFHRIVADFVAQGGCPRGDGWGGPATSLRCEINRLPYDRGAVGMALSGKDTGGSQFFITLSPQPHLDGGYTVIGHVTPASLPVVDSLRRFDVIRRATIVSGEPAVALAATE